MKNVLTKILFCIIACFIIVCGKSDNEFVIPSIIKSSMPINTHANVYIRSIHVLQQTMASGSGTVIMSQNHHSIILTAGHVCYPDWDGNLQNSILWVGDITTFNGQNIFYELI